MNPSLRDVSLLAFVIASVLGTPSHAAELEASIEIPALQVAEYHRPYVAIWLEGMGDRKVTNLAVWYQQKKGGDEPGTKWLPDLRQWWRRSGRSMTLPVDGVSGATRPVGRHTLSFASDHPALRDLPPGEYQLVVEAAREVGGRELIKIPLQWGGEQPQTHESRGKSELGVVSVSVRP